MDLKRLFELQGRLNRRLGFDHEAIAERLEKPDRALLQSCGQWIDDFLKAMASEMEELRDCTYWKHWCKEAQGGRRFEVHNLSGARKEVIDILHFWISLAQAVGMTPEMVAEMYEEKLEKNLCRQDDGYSIEVKTRAWELFHCYPYDHPAMTRRIINATHSLEDLDEEVQRYYLNWAKEVLEKQT